MSHILLQVIPMTEHWMLSYGNQKLYVDSKWKHCRALKGLCWNSMGLFNHPLKTFCFCFTALGFPESEQITSNLQMALEAFYLL